MIVYTGGTYDILHPGHLAVLRDCKALAGPGGQLVVALNHDDFIEAYKGQAPIFTYQERKACLLACRYVDRVVPNTLGSDSRPTIESVRPNIVAIGYDWALKDYPAQMGFDEEWLRDRNITLAYVGFKHQISSTEIKRRVLAAK